MLKRFEAAILLFGLEEENGDFVERTTWKKQVASRTTPG